MKAIRVIILVGLIALSCFIARGLFSMPKATDGEIMGFSTNDVIETIKIISQKQHSVAHTQERAEVREYLISRLTAIGDTPTIYTYPNQEAKGYKFEAVDILAEFKPLLQQTDTTYVMLVAHYDSRYAQPFRNDTVWSYGAADDGYGVSIAMECVETLLEKQNEWSQGVKILYTDAEEVGMIGMKNIYEHNPEVFANVGLVINIEARGPYGAALLFETSEGNKKLIDLYKDKAHYHVSYSLTNLVYSILPNFTDFTIVRDSIPGYNFATVEDINHYHTDFDNYNNISPDAIQHYASQIMPILNEYVTNKEYQDKEYLKSSDNYTYFTLPLIGVVMFTKNLYIWLALVLFVLYAISLIVELRKNSFSFKQMMKWSLNIFFLSLLAFVIGELIAYVSTLTSEVPFKFMGVVQGVHNDNAIMFISVIAIVCITSLIYILIEIYNFKNYSKLLLYSSLTVLSVLNLIMALVFTESFMFLIPLSCSLIAILIWQATKLKFMIPIAIALIILQSVSFYYLLAMALTIGALGAVMLLLFISVPTLIALTEIYIRKQ